MLRTLKINIIEAFNNKNLRSQIIIKNVLLSFGVKFGSVLIGLILVPMTLNYVGSAEYGLWLTVSSFISWMSFLDIGLSNGLKNKLATAIALNKWDDAKKYISTAYFIITIVSVFLFLAFSITIPLVDWATFFNITNKIDVNIRTILLIILSTFCLQFVFQIINTVLLAHQETALSGLLSFLGQLLVLITVYFLIKFVPGTLEVLVYALTINPLLILILASFLLFRTRYKYITPSFKHINLGYASPLLELGFKYFIIQIGVLLLFQTNNIILAKILGTTSVTQFNVVFKLYSVSSMLFTIALTPFWSAFTDAYAKGDYPWMINSMNKIRKLWLLTSLGVPVVCIFSPYLFKLWLADAIYIPFHLSASMALYTISYMGVVAYSSFINGVGKIQLVLYIYIFSSLVNVPMAIYATKLIGVAGPVVANTIIMFLICIILNIQINKILYAKDIGIWGK